MIPLIAVMMGSEHLQPRLVSCVHRPAFPIFLREMIQCLTWILKLLIAVRAQYDQIQQASST